MDRTVVLIDMFKNVQHEPREVKKQSRQGLRSLSGQYWQTQLVGKDFWVAWMCG